VFAIERFNRLLSVRFAGNYTFPLNGLQSQSKVLPMMGLSQYLWIGMLIRFSFQAVSSYAVRGIGVFRQSSRWDAENFAQYLWGTLLASCVPRGFLQLWKHDKFGLDIIGIFIYFYLSPLPIRKHFVSLTCLMPMWIALEFNRHRKCYLNILENYVDHTSTYLLVGAVK